MKASAAPPIKAPAAPTRARAAPPFDVDAQLCAHMPSSYALSQNRIALCTLMPIATEDQMTVLEMIREVGIGHRKYNIDPYRVQISAVE